MAAPRERQAPSETARVRAPAGITWGPRSVLGSSACIIDAQSSKARRAACERCGVACGHLLLRRPGVQRSGAGGVTVELNAPWSAAHSRAAAETMEAAPLEAESEGAPSWRPTPGAERRRPAAAADAPIGGPAPRLDVVLACVVAAPVGCSLPPAKPRPCRDSCRHPPLASRHGGVGRSSLSAALRRTVNRRVRDSCSETGNYATFVSK